MHTHTQNGFADRHKKQHARYFMDVISSTPIRPDSSAKLFILLHIVSLAPARRVHWDAVGHEVENNISQILTADNDFTSSENEQSQHFHARRILRMERTLSVPYSLIGQVLTID
jgi:hypothetical protein